MGIIEILFWIRVGANMIAEGRLEASKIKTMSDEELATYDDELVELIAQKQKESELLGHEGENK